MDTYTTTNARPVGDDPTGLTLEKMLAEINKFKELFPDPILKSFVLTRRIMGQLVAQCERGGHLYLVMDEIYFDTRVRPRLRMHERTTLIGHSIFDTSSIFGVTVVRDHELGISLMRDELAKMAKNAQNVSNL